ncbi:restriction endonuclease subunit S [Collinsella sp. HCP28S3_E5]|uniref:restriction endonuclease subunit S n=1 Tax=Collinsella sp. HCP28S3_E5 TaxID=3438922 RepID=UPI003F899E89
MSAIDELIAELCPDGVEYRKLGDVVDILDSKRKPVKRGERSKGEYPYYGANGIQDFVGGFIFDGTFLLVGEDGSVITADGKPIVNWAVGKIWVNNHAHVLQESADGTASLRYLKYALECKDVTDIVRGTPPKLNQKNLREIEIPVPPIEVQREIVRILDTFTSLTDELTAKLAEEVTARKQQYAYYRDRLLSLESLEVLDGKPVEMKTMGELFEMKAGAHISSTMISDDMDSSHLIPCYGGNGLRGYVENANQSGIALLIGRQGALCGNVCLASGEFYATEHAVVTKCRQDLIFPNYAFHMLTNRDLNQYKSAGAQPGLAVGKLKAVEFPVPSLATQQKVIDILDRFDALTTSLTDGLPAEIEARKAQYGYYRDRLLDFSAKEVLLHENCCVEIR